MKLYEVTFTGYVVAETPDEAIMLAKYWGVDALSAEAFIASCVEGIWLDSPPLRDPDTVTGEMLDVTCGDLIQNRGKK